MLPPPTVAVEGNGARAAAVVDGVHTSARRVHADRARLPLAPRWAHVASMNADDAANILGVDADTIEDLEDILGLDGPWTIADLERAAEVLDEDRDGEAPEDQDDDEATEDEDDENED